MKHTTYINLCPDPEAYVEIEYDYTPEGARLSYDQPPDPSSYEVVKVQLHTPECVVNVTRYYEELGLEPSVTEAIENETQNH
jgi:hypothetical protein